MKSLGKINEKKKFLRRKNHGKFLLNVLNQKCLENKNLFQKNYIKILNNIFLMEKV